MNTKSHLAVTVSSCHRAFKGLVDCNGSLCVAQCGTKLTCMAAFPFLLSLQQTTKDKARWHCINISYAKTCRCVLRKGASCLKSCGSWMAAHCCREEARSGKCSGCSGSRCSLSLMLIVLPPSDCACTNWLSKIAELSWKKKNPDFHCLYN